MSGPLPQPEWAKVREWADEGLARAHDALEHHSPEHVSAELRGRIKALRALIAWGEPEPLPDFTPPPEY